MTTARSLLIGGTLTAAAAVLAGTPTQAHKPITSRYTYNAEVYPIFLDRCGSCHAPEGVAPMSLLTYEDAYPWAQSIKEEIVNLGMPPWQPEDGFGSFKHGASLTARELDILIEWSNGGTPEGNRAQRPEPYEPSEDWLLGDPSLALEVPAPFTLGADALEATRYFAMPLNLDADRWVTAVDFRPGSPAIVRSALLYIDASGEAASLDAADPESGFALNDEDEEPGFTADRLLAAWVPGQAPVETDATTGYRLPAGADLVLRVHYKKTWTYEGIAVEDRSTVGLYFTEAPEVTAIETMTVAPPGEPTIASELEVTFEQTLDRNVALLAMIPNIGVGPSAVQVVAIHPDGRREPVIRLAQPRPQWRTRHWLETPMVLEKGSRLELAATYTSRADESIAHALSFTLDVVPLAPGMNVAAAP